MARGTVVTPLLFQESLYSNYFQPAGDCLRFMRQRAAQVGLTGLIFARRTERLKSNKKERKQEVKLSGMMKLFQYLTASSSSSSEKRKRERRATFSKRTSALAREGMKKKGVRRRMTNAH